MIKLKLAAVILFLFGVGSGSATAFGADNDQTNEFGKELAGRVWTILDAVEKNHVQSPHRHDLIVRGVQAMLVSAEANQPPDLVRRVSAISNDGQLQKLLAEIWPQEKRSSGVPDASLEMALLDGIFNAIPGRPFFISSAAQNVNNQLRGNRYVGTGVELTINQDEKLPQIVLPFRRGPARKAGALPGDLIVEIEGENMQGKEVGRSVELLRGGEGTTVTVLVRQPGATETRTLKIERGVVAIDSLYGYKRVGEDDWDFMVDPSSRIAYVWVMSIKSSTPHELRQIERRLQSEDVRAVVLDFRSSRGEGLLHDAGLLAGSLLDGKLMWTTLEKNESPKPWHAEHDPVFRDLPLAVLVNDMDAAAQGAVLAALQDNRRAILVGEPTKTDGAIRRMIELANQNGSLTVLTGRLERAERARGWPLIPDRIVELTDVEQEAIQKWLMSKKVPVLPAGHDDSAPSDPQLALALDLLRADLSSTGINR